jgi:hypothetical protein
LPGFFYAYKEISAGDAEAKAGGLLKLGAKNLEIEGKNNVKRSW